MLKIYFKIFGFIVLFCSTIGITNAVNINYDTDYINAIYDLPISGSGLLIDKVPGYNFFITHIDISSNCYEINCTNIFYDFDIYNSGTGTNSGTGGNWMYTIKGKKEGEYEQIVNILFKNDLFIINNNNQARVYIRLEGYFLKENSTSYDIYNSIYSFITDDRGRIIKTIILLNLFMIFLFLKTVRLGFRTGTNYFIKTKKDE